ncbi:MAG TPA: hypothetical protein PKV29_09220, partial [Trichococcus flocculiformis]|nr:hypothetical protein [Trichococcus flocculiformis]
YTPFLSLTLSFNFLTSIRQDFLFLISPQTIIESLVVYCIPIHHNILSMHTKEQKAAETIVSAAFI